MDLFSYYAKGYNKLKIDWDTAYSKFKNISNTRLIRYLNDIDNFHNAMDMIRQSELDGLTLALSKAALLLGDIHNITEQNTLTVKPLVDKDIAELYVSARILLRSYYDEILYIINIRCNVKQGTSLYRMVWIELDDFKALDRVYGLRSFMRKLDLHLNARDISEYPTRDDIAILEVQSEVMLGKLIYYDIYLYTLLRKFITKTLQTLRKRVVNKKSLTAFSNVLLYLRDSHLGNDNSFYSKIGIDSIDYDNIITGYKKISLQRLEKIITLLGDDAKMLNRVFKYNPGFGSKIMNTIKDITVDAREETLKTQERKRKYTK